MDGRDDAGRGAHSSTHPPPRSSAPCPVLEALLRGSPALQSLGLSGCQGVRTLAIPAGSPCLQSLELERCNGLEAVHVAAAAPLTRLSLVGCKALKVSAQRGVDAGADNQVQNP